MKLEDLIYMTRVYARDNNSYMFTDTTISMFINQAIDRLKQYKVFNGMKKLVHSSDVVTHVPEEYQYILALFAASRCFDIDERFYEGTEKRNEFEYYLSELISDVQAGNITISDGEGNAVEDTENAIEYVVDTYFESSTSNEDEL